MNKKQEIHQHHHYPPNWGKLIFQMAIGLLCFIIIANLASGIVAKITEKRIIHKNCLDSCEKKHFLGIKLGEDSDKNNCFVEEFDRTDCIKNCNDFYERIK